MNSSARSRCFEFGLKVKASAINVLLLLSFLLVSESALSFDLLDDTLKAPQLRVITLPPKDGSEWPQVAVSWSGPLPVRMEVGLRDDAGDFKALADAVELTKAMSMMPHPAPVGAAELSWRVLDSQGQELALVRDGSINVGWQPDFYGPGVDGEVFATTIYDGDLIVAGRFFTAGQWVANNIARWDGSQWFSLDGPLAAGVSGDWETDVRALFVYDGELIAGGRFTEAGGQSVNNIARWNGAEWSSLDGLSGSGLDGSVRALTVYNNKLIAGGSFATADGIEVNQIARWDGSEWSGLESAMGMGVSGPVHALGIHEDKLVVGGSFESAGGENAKNIVRWDGSQWSGLEGPAGEGVNGQVSALINYGGALIVGGQFSTAGGVAVSRIAKWDGDDWSNLDGLSGSGLDGSVRTLTVYNNELIAGGSFATAAGIEVNQIARWDGVQWNDLQGPGSSGVAGDGWLAPSVDALFIYQGELFAGGDFETAGSVEVNGIARWNGSEWNSVEGVPATGVGFSSAGIGFDHSGGVFATVVYDGHLIVGGEFLTAGGQTVNGIARWSGSDWSGLEGPEGVGIDHFWEPSVRSLAVYGDDLVVGGQFTIAGGVQVENIARWNGSEWASLDGYPGAGVNGPVNALTVYENDLIVGGHFTNTGTAFVNCIARWDGVGWSSLDGPSGAGIGWCFEDRVYALAVYGDELIAGGNFLSAGGEPARNIARWNGAAWSGLGSGSDQGTTGEVNALMVYGDDLIVGGGFLQAGATPANKIARWTGSDWYSLDVSYSDTGFAEIHALQEYNSDLIVGGNFLSADGSYVNSIARWNGSEWSRLNGLAGFGVDGIVRTLTLYNDELIAGGSFKTAGGLASWNLGRYVISYHDIGGTVSGLAPSTSLILQNSDGSEVVVTANGFFNFSNVTADGSSYMVSVLSQPQGQYCSVNNGAGTVVVAPIEDIEVICSPTRLLVDSVRLESGVGGVGWRGASEPTAVAFPVSFSEPPVVITMPGNEGSGPASVRIRNVSSSGFEVSAVSAPPGDDSAHLMTVHYVAALPGDYRLPIVGEGDGPRVQVGRWSTSTIQYNPAAFPPNVHPEDNDGEPGSACSQSPQPGWDSNSFPGGPFDSPPVLLTSIQSWNNEGDNLDANIEGPSSPFMNVALHQISDSGFDGAIELSEARRNVPCTGLENSESIGYLAMDSNVNALLAPFGGEDPITVVTSIGESNRGEDNDPPTWSTSHCRITELAVDGGFAKAGLKGFAALRSRDESDGGWLRRCSLTSPAPDSVSIALRIDEDDHFDSERRQTPVPFEAAEIRNESVSILVFAKQQAIVLSEPTSIGPGDTDFSGEYLIVDGTELTVDGEHQFAGLELINGAVLTHPSITSHLLELRVGSVIVDSTSSIDVTAKGSGRRWSLSGDAGGSYGGWGSLGNDSAVSNPPFGDLREPVDRGVGGSISSFRGGGSIKLVADSLVLEGTIRADGEPGIPSWNEPNRGHPSGGSVWLEVGHLSGGGEITAIGGERPSGTSVPGGGGRIAIYYDQLAEFDPIDQVSARGGNSRTTANLHGGAGTVYLKDNAEPLGLVRIENSPLGASVSAFTDFNDSTAELVEAVSARVQNSSAIGLGGLQISPGSQWHAFGQIDLAGSSELILENQGSLHLHVSADNWTDVTVNGGTLVVNHPQAWTSLKVQNGGLITHDVPLGDSEPFLDLSLSSLWIDATSKIDVTGRGQRRLDGYSGDAGGSYGGWGGRRSLAETNPPFGSLREPSDYGVGGSRTNLRGGGRVRLEAESLQLDGKVLADGQQSTGCCNGFPSGGSIWINVGTLSGAGQFKARGGWSTNTNNFDGGGGGRISLFYDNAPEFDYLNQISARGSGLSSSLYEAGGAGTVYLKDNAEPAGLVWIDNGETGPDAASTDIEQNIPDLLIIANSTVDFIAAADLTSVSASNSIIHQSEPITLSSLSMENSSWHQAAEITGLSNRLELLNSTFFPYGDQAWSTIDIGEGAVISHATDDEAGVQLSASRVLVHQGGAIDVTVRGHVALEGTTGRHGGSHGGLGGVQIGAATNPVYGVPEWPSDLGAGGSSTRGGGRITIVADELVVDGEISAGGGSESINSRGLGSGGSILIDVGLVSGSGRIDADGGRGQSNSAGGGGGRIAVYYGAALGSILDSVESSGGQVHSGEPGEDGTVFLSQVVAPPRVVSLMPDAPVNHALTEFEIRFSQPIASEGLAADDIMVEGPEGLVPIQHLAMLEPARWRVVLTIPMTQEGDYEVSVGPEVLSAHGLWMDQDGDSDGSAPGSGFEGTITIDLTPPSTPEVTSHPISPVVNTVFGEQALLIGKRDADAAVVVNGSPRSQAGSEDWIVLLDLPEGYSQWDVQARDRAGNLSETISVNFFRPADLPAITGMTPVSGSCLPEAPDEIGLYVYEAESGIDLASSTREVLLDDQIVDGTWEEFESIHIFTPQAALVDGRYEVLAELVDNVGQISAPFEGHFLVDSLAPMAPEIDAYPSETSIILLTLSGTKEADSGIWIDGTLAVSIDDSTEWSHTLTLLPGPNQFIVESRDCAGNASPQTQVDVVYDNTPPGPVQISLEQGADGRSVLLDWSDYDELENGGNIDFYTVYIAEEAFTHVSAADILGNTPAGAQSYVAEDLTPFETWHFAVVATDQSGNYIPVVTSAAIPIEDEVPPEDVTGLAVVESQETTLALVWNPSVDSAGDLAGHRVYLDESAYGDDLPPDASSLLIEGLAPATGYLLRVTALDDVGNESEGVTLAAATLLANPDDLEAQPAHQGATLSWSHSQPESLVQLYRIYVDTQDFSSIEGREPHASAVSSHAQIGGLENDQTYFVAVTAVNISGGERLTVSTVTVTPSNLLPPENVTNLTVVSLADALELSWNASADSQGDLAGYRVYVDDEDPIELNAQQTALTLSDLAPATTYQIRVTAFDVDNNENSGRNITGVTWLDNPDNLTGLPLDGQINLTWSPVEPHGLVHRYAVYLSDEPFSDISAMEPVQLRTRSFPNAQLTDLINDQTYYVAVSTRNVNGGENPQVSAIAVQPRADTDGPEITDLRYRGEVLEAGAVLTRSGTISLSAEDESGVTQVVFVSDGNLDVVDASGGTSFQAYWSLEDESDGENLLTITALDSVGNPTVLSIPVVIYLAPPPAPQITSPADGWQTNQANITVSGQAIEAAEVQLSLHGSPVGDWSAVNPDGSFSESLTLLEGDNAITARARNNRGLAGPSSSPVTVTLDTEIPDAPLGLSATARQAGVIRVRWQPPGGDDLVYQVYRSDQPFDSTDQAVRVNSVPITDLQLDDATPVDQRYYYRVVAETNAGNQSAPSTLVDAVSDRIPPRALTISYQPEGAHDPDGNRFGPGNVSVTVEVSEPLLTTPFLSMTPEGGIPMTVGLFQIDDLLYQGSFEIRDDTVSATTWAVFSAYDQAGNRGTEVDSGATIVIDTDGPDVQHLGISPEPPINNVGGVQVVIDLELTEAVSGPDDPVLEYQLSGDETNWMPIPDMTAISALVLIAEFELPATAGQFEAETLRLRWHAEDDLGNIGDRILSPHQFQVYQNELPPLDPPGMLDVWPLPAGQVGLMWAEVPQAAAYEVWRREAGAGDFLPVGRVFDLDFIDQTPIDGDYEYTVVSVRQANDQESISGPGPIRLVTSDSVRPEPPTNLVLTLTGSGILAEWQAPDDEDDLRYRLYRSDQAVIDDVSDLVPVVDGTPHLVTIDPAPEVGEHTYAVTSLDEAGNESDPSESVYLNFELLPVSSIAIERFADQAPVISWTHGGSSLAGFNIYAQQNPGRFKLNPELLTGFDYTDIGYTGGERAYGVTAVDANEQESDERVLRLPDVSVEPLADAVLRRGLINGVEVLVHDRSGQGLDGLSLQLDLAGREHQTQTFDLEPGEQRIVRVPVPGYSDLGDSVTGQLYLDYRPELNASTRLGQGVTLPVQNGGMVVSLITETFTRGGAGRVRVRIENPGDESVDVLTARSNGANPSPDLRLKLLDIDNNVLSIKPFEQYLGDDVITLPNGYTIARIPAGGSWTSQWQDMFVPASAPNQVWVELDIDHFYHRFGDLDLALSGLSTRRETSLVDTSYFGELISADPASSYGTDPIVIQGRAVERATGQAMSDVALKLVLSTAGFERIIDVMAEDDGEFSYAFEPLPTEAGIYEVSVVHPEILDRPVQGYFTIERLSISPSQYNLHHPYNTPWTIPIEVTAGSGTQASQVRFVYLPEDQTDGQLIPGLTVDVDDSIGQILPGEKLPLGVTLEAQDHAPASGTLYLRLISDQSQGQPLAMLRVNFQFSAASPALRWQQNQLNFGLIQGQTRSRTARITNIGFAPAEQVMLALVDDTDPDTAGPAPDWVSLGIDAGPHSIGIGEHIDIPITVSPPTDIGTPLSERWYLVATSANAPAESAGLNVDVVNDAEGDALFHIRNMYTATLDENGNVVAGLAGARVRLQDEIVLSNVHEGYTDQNGEFRFEEIPAGQYLFRVTAPNHQAGTGRITIQPGATEPVSVFLSYNLVQVEWSVTETTIEDEYEIILSAIFETNVPAAVLVADPMHRTLPNMQAGDVFNTQFTLTNHGLIRANDVVIELPPEDAYFRYELLDQVPTQIQAMQSIIVPYRMIAKQNFPPTAGGPGGCFSYTSRFNCPYGYQCADGTEETSRAQHFLSRILGSGCGSSGGPVGGGGAGPWPGGGGGPGGGSPPSNIGGTTCAPNCEGAGCCGAVGPGG